jgi:hypothetical protein
MPLALCIMSMTSPSTYPRKKPLISSMDGNSLPHCSHAALSEWYMHCRHSSYPLSSLDVIEEMNSKSSAGFFLPAKLAIVRRAGEVWGENSRQPVGIGF